MKHGFFNKIDWELLRSQRNWLLSLEANEKADGLINMIDDMQDYASSVLGIDDRTVYAFKVLSKLELAKLKELMYEMDEYYNNESPAGMCMFDYCSEFIDLENDICDIFKVSRKDLVSVEVKELAEKLIGEL